MRAWGVKRSGFWWVVVASTLLLNLGHGPWQGCAWFSKWLEAGEDLLQVEGANGRLVGTLYSAICKDLGVETSGGPLTGRQCWRDC